MRRRRAAVWFLAAGLGLSGRVDAAPIFMSGFDGVDDATTTAIDASFEFTEQFAGSGTADADARAQTSIAHDAAAGGATGSKYALRAEATGSGRSAYYIMANSLSPSDPSVTIGFSLYAASALSGPRVVGAMRESDASNYGCGVVLNAGKTLTLAYFGGSDGSCAGTEGTQSTCDSDELCYAGACRKTWGTTSDLIQATACTTNPTIPCTTNGDCPNADCASTRYWAGIELGQTLGSTSQVTCELYLNGAAIFTGTPRTIGGTPVANVVNAALGMTNAGTITSTGTVHIDDFVMDEGGRRAYYGYVDRKAANGIGDENEWTANSCRGSSNWECVNDYNNPSAYTYDDTGSNNNTLQSSQVGRLTDLTLTPTITVKAGESVSALEGLVIGRGTGSFTGRRISQALLAFDGVQWVARQSGATPGSAYCTCSTGAACSGGICVVPDDTTHRVLQRFVTTDSPIPGAAAWDPNNLRQRIQNQNTSPTRTVYVGATTVYVRVQKADTNEDIGSLVNHNRGSETGGVEGAGGLITIAAIGDSTLGGTLEVNCVGGTNNGNECGQQDSCGWDSVANGGHADLPPGGCAQYGCTADGTSECQECRRCTGDRSVHCEEDADCSGIGTCDLTNDVCTPACPGGFCPTDRVGWAQNLSTNTGADVVISCPGPGEDLSQMYNNRFSDILSGKGSTTTACVALTGTGACTCATGADCDPGGTCASGLCTAGPENRTACTQASDCNSPSQFCQLPKPDYVVVLEGYNDPYVFPFAQTHDPACTGLLAFGLPYTCPAIAASPSGYQVARTVCSLDSDCASLSPLSKCLGARRDTPYGNCLFPSLTGNCATATGACHTDADCTLGRTCTETNTDAPGAAGSGYCACASNTNCPSGYHCVGPVGGPKMCRKSCTGEPDTTNCGSSGVCDTTTCDTSGRCDQTTYNFCRGRCSAPCDAKTCSSDSECGGVAHSRGNNSSRAGRFRGKCNLASGRCACCGITSCGELPIIMRAGCSCTEATKATDCGGGAVCTNGVCTAGDSGRTNCLADSACASGRQCMRCTEQARQFDLMFEGLIGETAQKMLTFITNLGEGTAGPRLLMSVPPMTNGLRNDGGLDVDRACGGFYGARAHYANAGAELAAVLASRYIIDQTPFNSGRMALAYHADDSVHFSSAGSVVVGLAVSDKLNLLNVCIKADGTAQKYCRTKAGSYAGDDPCTTNADCSASGRTCSRRPCNGSGSNCPEAGDSCNGD